MHISFAGDYYDTVPKGRRNGIVEDSTVRAEVSKYERKVVHSFVVRNEQEATSSPSRDCVVIVARNKNGGTSSPLMGEDGGEGDIFVYRDT